MRANSSMRSVGALTKRLRRGFSIVETVVAMAVVLLLTASGIAACTVALKLQNNAIRAENVYNASEEFVAAYLRLAEAEESVYRSAVAFSLGQEIDIVFGTEFEYTLAGGSVRVLATEDGIRVIGQVRGLGRNIYEYDSLPVGAEGGGA